MINVQNLTVQYKKIKAVDNISFDVRDNEIFGMIGPNGAGKTTAIECVEGLRKPTAGYIDVMGIDPSNRKELYQHIGVQLQEAIFPDAIRVGEVSRLFSSFYENPLDYRELLERFGLGDKIKSPVKKLSGGEKQKLSVATALIGAPQVLFLDELTTGLDPKARIDMWELIKSLREEGRTIFMTTHFMDEAEYLCDRICLVVKGRIAALGTASDLVAQADVKQKITFYAPKSSIPLLRKIRGVEEVSEADGVIDIQGRDKNLERNVMICLIENKVAFEGFHSVIPSLEDVFLKMTSGKEEKK